MADDGARLTVRIPAPMRVELERLASANEHGVSSEVRIAVKRHLHNQRMIARA